MSDIFKILTADKLAEEGLAYIRSQPDADLDEKPGLNEQELAAIIGNYDGLILRSGVHVTADVLSKTGQLKAIARAGVGVDNIDLEAATAAGVLVMNSAQASTITTAEHAFGLLMALARNIGQAYKHMTEGGWDRHMFQGRQLAGKTLGIIGFGRIGQAVAIRALAFDMHVMAYDPFFNAETALDGKVKMYGEFNELLPHADMLTFHVPHNDQTHGLMGESAFGLCKKSILVVNASRGGVIDEKALLAALDSDQCAGAALDVFENEPLDTNDPLRHHRNVLVTPHLGASTVEAQEAVSTDAAVALLDYLRGHDVRGAVNVPGLRLDLDPLQNRYVDVAQRMAQLLSPMISEGISQVTLEVAGENLAAAANTIERLALIGLLQPHLDTSLNVVNVQHVAEHRGISLRTVIADEDRMAGPQIALEVNSTDRTHRIVGRVYTDMRPRVVEINSYHMDMIPAGNMVLICNEDTPGIIGTVGMEFGRADINIADMAISRRVASAMMLLRVDEEPPQVLIDRLLSCPGILKVCKVKLPEEQL